jgi:hypothetical protein
LPEIVELKILTAALWCEYGEIAALAFHPEELLARICSHSHLKCGYQLAQRRRIGRAEDVTQLTFKDKTNAVSSTSL